MTRGWKRIGMLVGASLGAGALSRFGLSGGFSQSAGSAQDGFFQVLEGRLHAGELVATESALFLGNVRTSAGGSQ